jgi:hypothetical protein
MADDDLARELEALLAVEPAPDFRGRVRERIANDRVRRQRRVALAIAASALLAVGTSSWVLRQREAMTTPEPMLSSRHIVPSVLEAPRQPVRSLPSQPVVRVARHPGLPAHVLSPLDVVVDAREAVAWRRMLAGVRTGDVDLSRLARSTPWASPAENDEFLLPLVIIEPLPADPREQGVHQ